MINAERLTALLLRAGSQSDRRTHTEWDTPLLELLECMMDKIEELENANKILKWRIEPK
jgi:hypothetical protein